MKCSTVNTFMLIVYSIRNTPEKTRTSISVVSLSMSLMEVLSLTCAAELLRLSAVATVTILLEAVRVARRVVAVIHNVCRKWEEHEGVRQELIQDCYSSGWFLNTYTR